MILIYVENIHQKGRLVWLSYSQKIKLLKGTCSNWFMTFNPENQSDISDNSLEILIAGLENFAITEFYWKQHIYKNRIPNYNIYVRVPNNYVQEHVLHTFLTEPDICLACYPRFLDIFVYLGFVNQITVQRFPGLVLNVLLNDLLVGTSVILILIICGHHVF